MNTDKEYIDSTHEYLKAQNKHLPDEVTCMSAEERDKYTNATGLLVYYIKLGELKYEEAVNEATYLAIEMNITAKPRAFAQQWVDYTRHIFDAFDVIDEAIEESKTNIRN